LSPGRLGARSAHVRNVYFGTYIRAYPTMDRKRSPKTMVWWDCNKVLGGKKGPSKIALFLVPRTSWTSWTRSKLYEGCIGRSIVALCPNRLQPPPAGITPPVAGCRWLGAAMGDWRPAGDGCMPSGPGREEKRHKGQDRASGG
jgi:hypothetical protein